MKARGQAALEYLMTYGWALVVIIIVVAALFALGILSPATYQGSTCRGFGKIGYRDHVADSATGKFKITLFNGTGADIDTNGAKVGLDCDGDGSMDASIQNTGGIWRGSESADFNINYFSSSDCNTTIGTSSGATYNVSVIIEYEPKGMFKKKETARCTGVTT